MVRYEGTISKVQFRNLNDRIFKLVGFKKKMEKLEREMKEVKVTVAVLRSENRCLINLVEKLREKTRRLP